MAQPTKAQLEAQIASLKAQPSAEDQLIIAIANVIAGGSAERIKHMFFRRDAGMLNISLDMHE